MGVIKQNKIFEWDYSEYSDILNIHKKNVHIAEGSEFGDIDLDFDKQGNVIGIQILWASEFLAPTGITKKQLEELNNAEILLTHPNKETTVAWIKLGIPNNPDLVLPLPVPLHA